MKRYTPKPLLAIVLLFTACSSGIKKDLNTGLTATYQGFSVDDIFLADKDNNAVKSNKVRLGEVVKIIANDVSNFTEKNGRVYPGCSIILTDKAGKEILNLPDAFSDLTDGKAKAEAKMLNAYLTTGAPMETGQTYHLKTRFFDKLKVESHITADVDIVME